MTIFIRPAANSTHILTNVSKPGMGFKFKHVFKLSFYFLFFIFVYSSRDASQPEVFLFDTQSFVLAKFRELWGLPDIGMSLLVQY
jgi:hypothetical protein